MRGGVHTTPAPTREQAAPEELDTSSADGSVIAGNVSPPPRATGATPVPDARWAEEEKNTFRTRSESVTRGGQNHEAQRATRRPEAGALNPTCSCARSCCHQELQHSELCRARGWQAFWLWPLGTKTSQGACGQMRVACWI